MATDFSMYSGDSKSLAITITDKSGSAVDLTGATVKYAIAGSATATTKLVSKQTGGAGITTALNVATVTIDPADTEAIAGIFYQEIETTDINGYVSTSMVGTITIAAEVN